MPVMGTNDLGLNPIPMVPQAKDIPMENMSATWTRRRDMAIMMSRAKADVATAKAPDRQATTMKLRYVVI